MSFIEVTGINNDKVRLRKSAIIGYHLQDGEEGLRHTLVVMGSDGCGVKVKESVADMRKLVEDSDFIEVNCSDCAHHILVRKSTVASIHVNTDERGRPSGTIVDVGDGQFEVVDSYETLKARLLS